VDEEKFKNEIFTDYNGYLRWKDSKRLVHRSIAEKQIYEKDRKKYPLPFEEYQVHHVDKNKSNNKTENLQLLTKREHEELHCLVRAEWYLIYLLSTIILIQYFLSIFGRIAFENNFDDMQKIIGGVLIIFISFIIFYFFTRKNKKYI